MTPQATPQVQAVRRAVRFGASPALAVLGALGLTIMGFGAHKANAMTDQLGTEARITGAMSIDCSAQELNFGAIVASGVAGTVTVNPAGGASDGGGAAYVSGAAAGECVVQGNVSAPYEIDYVVSDLTGPGTDMTLTNLVSDNLNGHGPFIGLGTHAASLDVAGADMLSVGGTVNVGVNQAPGLYTGTIDVTVDYP